MAVIEADLANKLFTYEDYMREVEAGIVDPCEYVDGVRIEVTAPSNPHQRILLRLIRLLANYADQYGGECGLAPSDLMISRRPLRVREPDLLYATEVTLTKHGEFPDIGSITFPVDLVVEILSPSERRGAITSKLADYAVIGVPECWIVSPEAQDITVQTLEGGAYRKAAVFSAGETLTTASLPGIEIDIDTLFAPRNKRRVNQETQK